MTFSNICRVYINIPRMASNIFRQIARQKLKISLKLFNFGKEVSRLTESQTYNKYTHKQREKKCLDLGYKH